MALLLPAALLAILLLRPIWDVDIFWQLKLGDLALDQGKLATEELFAARHLGEPAASLSWLAQIIMAMVRRVGGWSALQVFDATLWLGGFMAAAHAARRLTTCPAGLVGAVLMAFDAALPNASIRPQSFAVLCFGLLLALLASPRRWEVKAIAGLALLVLWQNLHPSVMIAALYLGARTAWSWLAVFKDRRHVQPRLETALLLGALTADIATPVGLAIFSVSSRNAAASSAMQVSEWLPLWSPRNLELLPVMIVLQVLFLVLVWFKRHRLDWQWLMPCLVLLAASALAVRFSLFWALSAIPVVAPLLALKRPISAAPRRGSALLAVALCAAVALVLHQPRFSQAIPRDAIAALQRTGVKGTIFAEIEWGGPLIDTGYPGWLVALDGRYYVYSNEELQLARIAGTSATGLDQIEEAYYPSAILVDPEFSPVLAARLRAQPAIWHEVFGRARAAAFMRITPPGLPGVQRRPVAQLAP